MKKIWHKYKKLIMGGMAAVLVASIVISQVIVNETEAEAAYLLNSMSTYMEHNSHIKDNNQFTILEIVPETDDHEYEEIGAFMSNGDGQQNPWLAMKSSYFDREKTGFRASLINNQMLDTLLEMRLLGLVKKEGSVTGHNQVEVLEYPVYSWWNSAHPTFQRDDTGYGSMSIVPDGYLFTYGTYQMKDGGSYKLKDGYFIGDSDGMIYRRGEDGGSVSADTIPVPATNDTDEDENVDENENENETEDDLSVSGNSFEKTSKVGNIEEVTIDEGIFDGTQPEQDPEDKQDNTTDNQGQNNGYTVQPVYNDYYNYDSLPVSANDIRVNSDWSIAYYRNGGDEPYVPLPEGIEWVGAGNGDVEFTPNDNGPYWGRQTLTMRYALNQNIKYYNSDWFKALVFGNRNSQINITVNTKAAKDVTKQDISDADLVYISGTAEAFSANGSISNEVFETIYNESVVGVNGIHKAIIWDYDACRFEDNEGNAIAVGATTSNLDKLAILLWQADQKQSVVEYQQNNYFNDSGAIVNVDSLLLDTSVFTNLRTSILKGVEGNFVTGNLYVYDHHRDLFKDPKSMVDANDIFANGDFNSSYRASVYNEAFNNVYTHIMNNNAEHPDYAIAEDTVTPALIVQYILSTDGSTAYLAKASVNVLEIQPCAAFLYNEDNYESKQYAYCKAQVKKNRDEFIKAYINKDWVSDTNGKQGNVSFTSMTVNEFICRNEVVGEKYDIVYIGSEISSTVNDSAGRKYYYTIGNAKSKDIITNEVVTTTITNFADDAMDGMVYYNIGDKVRSSSSQMGKWLAQETGSNFWFRYAGRDLNTEKLEELKSYLDAGHPIIVAKDLMCSDKTKTKNVNPTKVTNAAESETYDHGRIDSSSKMYELFMYAMNKEYNKETGQYEIKQGNSVSDNNVWSTTYKNFISEGDVANGLVSSDEISSYLNVPKLYLEISSKPTEYSYELMSMEDAGTTRTVVNPDSVEYLQPDEDGNYYLDYEFTISGVSSTDQNYAYNVKLLVDVNSDGKFSSDEECSDAVVTYALTGQEVERGENGEYELYEGTDYKLRRIVPESYNGIIPWCLRAQISSDSRLQTNEIGYTCVKAVQKTEIRILQITRASGSNLNLEQQITGDTGFGKYLNNLADYTVKVKTLTTTQYVNAYKTYKSQAGNENKTAMDFFNDYQVYTSTSTTGSAGKGVNMLVLGFGDNYEQIDNSTGAVDAIKAFIDSGRPVLLTHDFLMFYGSNQEKLLREVVGMDRYGVTSGLKQLKRGSDGWGAYLWKDTAYDDDMEEYAGMTAGQEAESTGKQVAYQPGSERTQLLTATQGYADSSMTRYLLDKNQPSNTFLSDSYKYNSGTFQNYYMNHQYMVDQLNEGQLTEYPYHISKSFKVSNTHAQYYQLDMETDADKDGSTDVTVWYALSYDSAQSSRTSLKNSVYATTPGDGANQYYIYNKGNVTYTGAGHSTIIVEEEIKLFVNTLLSAYSAVDQAPEVKLYETPTSVADELNNIAIPYDSTITKGVDADGNINPNVTDSSIQFNTTKNDYDYKFVDPNTNPTVMNADKTAVYFKATDANFKKGTKRMSLTFYKEVDLDREAARISDTSLTDEEIRNGAYVTSAAAKTGKRYLRDDGQYTVIYKKTMGGTDVYLAELKIDVYEADFSTKLGVTKEILDKDGKSVSESQVQSGKMYGIYLPLSYLRNNGTLSIYVEAQTYVSNIATSGATTAEVNENKGYTKLDITKVDLLKLD